MMFVKKPAPEPEPIEYEDEDGTVPCQIWYCSGVLTPREPAGE